MKGKTLIIIISVVIIGGIILLVSLTTPREQTINQPVISVDNEAEEATFTTIARPASRSEAGEGDERTLSEFRGGKVMF